MMIAQGIADLLSDDLGAAFIVRPHAFVPDGKEPNIGYVSVQRTALSMDAPGAGGSLPSGALVHEFTITIMSAFDEPAKAEPDLDASLMAVVNVLRTDPDLSGLQWSSANRVAVADAFHGFEISCWCISTNEE